MLSLKRHILCMKATFTIIQLVIMKQFTDSGSWILNLKKNSNLSALLIARAGQY